MDCDLCPRKTESVILNRITNSPTRFPTQPTPPLPSTDPRVCSVSFSGPDDGQLSVPIACPDNSALTGLSRSDGGSTLPDKHFLRNLAPSLCCSFVEQPQGVAKIDDNSIQACLNYEGTCTCPEVTHYHLKRCVFFLGHI